MAANNTNYTTKTASLKAIKADVRKVTANEVTANTVYVDHTVEKDGVNVTESVDVVSLIKDAQESAAISVGRDADKNWQVDDTAFDMVKKISFLGDYVNVVKGSNGEVKLYIGENKSLDDGDKSALKGDYPSTSSVLLYTHTDDFDLPVDANKTECSAVVTKEGSNFTQTVLTGKSATTGSESFTLDKADYIWVRTTYEGTTSTWGKVSLAKNRGVYHKGDIAANGVLDPTTSKISSKVAFEPDKDYKEVAMPTGITMNIGNYVLTADNDAQNGKVPDRTETSFDITIDWDTILTQDGGTVKFEWAIGAADTAGSAPASSVSIIEKTLFFTEYDAVTLENVSATLTTPVYSDAVSGLKYNTTGSKVTVTTGKISKSQFKSSTSTKRLNINAAGKSYDYSNGELTLESGSVDGSDAVYKLNESSSKSNVIALGSTDSKTLGTADVTVTPHGFDEGSS